MTANKPDNVILINLLNAWAKDMSKDNYSKVRRELMEGNSFLMIPSGKNENDAEGWRKLAEVTKIRLASVYTVDGVKTLGAFTDEEAVLRWSKGMRVFCNSLQSQDVFEICQKNGIKRIVINSGSDNIFPLSYYTDDEILPEEEVW
jgi:hypothetical protein